MTPKEKATPETAVEEQVTPEADPMEELVKVIIPLTKEHQEDVFIRVNQRTWLVKRGEEVELPKCAVLVYQESERATMEMLQFQMKNAKD